MPGFNINARDLRGVFGARGPDSGGRLAHKTKLAAVFAAAQAFSLGSDAAVNNGNNMCGYRKDVSMLRFLAKANGVTL